MNWLKKLFQPRQKCGNCWHLFHNGRDDISQQCLKAKSTIGEPLWVGPSGWCNLWESREKGL